MVITASIKKKKLYRKYVDIVNVLFDLSNREMDVLALLLELDNDWHTGKYKNILDTSSRRYIMKETYVNKSNLSRYISTYKEKNIVVPVGEDGWEINRKVMPIIKDNKIVITFNISIDED